MFLKFCGRAVGPRKSQGCCAKRSSSKGSGAESLAVSLEFGFSWCCRSQGPAFGQQPAALGRAISNQAKASAMPLHHGSWRNQNKRRFPSRPEPSQKNPEQVVPYRQSMAGTLGMQGYELQELLKRSARFSSRRSLREPQGADDPAKEVAKRQDHG